MILQMRISESKFEVKKKESQTEKKLKHKKKKQQLVKRRLKELPVKDLMVQYKKLHTRYIRKSKILLRVIEHKKKQNKVWRNKPIRPLIKQKKLELDHLRNRLKELKDFIVQVKAKADKASESSQPARNYENLANTEIKDILNEEIPVKISREDVNLVFEKSNDGITMYFKGNDLLGRPMKRVVERRLKGTRTIKEVFNDVEKMFNIKIHLA